MFLFGAQRYLSELALFQPAMASATADAMHLAYRDLDFCRLDEASFVACPSPITP